MNSTHKVEVVRLTEFEPHPNADRLDVVRVWAYTCCVGKGQFKEGQLAAYLPPDSVVDTKRPEFLFLDKDGSGGSVRIKSQRLRGVWSQGLLVPAPDGLSEGDDAARALGVTHYNPPESFSTDGEYEQDAVGSPKYDVDSAYRYADVIKEGEQVVATEKIHGTNARFCFKNGAMHVGSHNKWIVKDDKSLYWKILDEYPEIETWCRKYEGFILCGEIYGMQSLNYGLKTKGKHGFAAFDIMRSDFRFLDYPYSREIGYNLSWVPTIYVGDFDFDRMVTLSQGQSTIRGADHIREGIVVAPLKRRHDLTIGDVKLKFVNPKYLEKGF